MTKKAGDFELEEDGEGTKVSVATGVKEARYISLVRKPANQVGFKVVRDDNEGGNKVSKTAEVKPVRTRIRRSDSALLGVTFASNVSESDALAYLEEHGLAHFSVEGGADSVVAYRNDAAKAAIAEGKQTAVIRLDDNVLVHIPKPEAKNTDGTPAGISVVRVDFSADKFAEEADIKQYCEENGIDFPAAGVENGETVKSIKCSDGEFGDTRSIVVGDGVELVVARTDVTLVPPAFIEVVSETAYGNWGWGQLDFLAYMADREFSEEAEDATYYLRNVLDRIIFYSSLPLDVRKELIGRACSQYAEYLNTLIDALPQKVLIANRSDTKGNKMGTKTESPQKPETTPTDVAVTRADVQAMIDEANKPVTEKLDAIIAAVARKDEPAAAEPAATDKGEPAATPVAVDVTRSMEEMTAAFKVVVERMDKLESTTVVRSDAGDNPSKAQPAEPVKRSDKEVFSGILGGRSVSAEDDAE